MQVGEPEGLARSFARIGAGQRRQEVALLRQRLAQRRQCRLGLRQRRFLHGDVAAVAQALVQPALQQVEHFAVDRDQLIGGLDLAAQRGLGDRRDHDVRCQRQIGGLDLEALHVGERLQRFHRAPIEAPDVERVGDLQLRGIEIVDVGAGRRHRRQRSRSLIARRIEIGLHQRKEFALLGVDRLLRGAQRRHGRLQVGIVGDRSLDQRVERGRLEHRPPFLGNVAAGDETLALAGGDIGRRRLRGERLAGVAGDFGRGGMNEIRSDRATCQQHHGRESGGTCRQPPDRHIRHR